MLPEKTIIILSGKKQTGKDTFAQYFIKDGFYHFAFADNLKKHLQQFLLHQFGHSISLKEFYDNQKKENPDLVFICSEKSPFSIRELMQWYGDIVRKKFGKFYWVKRLALDIIKSEYTKIIITDARFEFEIKGIKKFLSDYKIVTILIERDTNLIDNHITEKGIRKGNFNFIFKNDLGLDELKQFYNSIKSII